MPSIINAPVRNRRNSRGLTEAQTQEYIDLMSQATSTDVVLVDDSDSDNYESSYARGERVRIAAKKYALTTEHIQVIAFQNDEGEYVASVRFKK